MLKNCVVGSMVWACVAWQALFAQAPVRKLDFRRDVQPLFKEHCTACHGPSQQMNGFRLDRRRDAMKGGTLTMIGPGNSEASRLYLRLIGNQYGLQMPPTGPLTAAQIDIVKTWIDQGAEWPDDVSGETPPPPPDPQATRMMQALRDGDRQAFRKTLGENRKAVNGKGPGGSTPLMYAALYGDAGAVRLLLESGADPNIRNEAGASALMWAVDDLEKTRLLLDRGGDANARSDGGRTPLLIAAGRFGSGAVVKLLLDHGANPSAKSPGLGGDRSVLTEAVSTGDEAVVRMLIERGADVKAAAFLPLFLSVKTNCAKCIDLFMSSAGPDILNPAMILLSPPFGDAQPIKLLLDHGADPNAKDPGGNTILMLAAGSSAVPVEAVKALLGRGADVNAKNAAGETALYFAKRVGPTAIVDLLRQAGANETSAPAEPAVKPKPASSARVALQRSIPLLQRTDATFIRKAGCVSCHNNTLTAMTIAAARKSGLPVDDRIASRQVKAIAAYVDGWRERALQGIGIPGDADTVAYILVGMAAENHAPDAATDAMAAYLKSRQLPNGQWTLLAHRPPLESSEIEVTATSMRAIQVYAPKARRAEYDRTVQLASAWLAKALSKTNEDRAFQLLGMAWAGGERGLIRKAAQELLAEQRPDGGWAQLPSLASDAYATGQALVALRDSRALAVTEPAYKRGVQFLLTSQLEDGSWYVKSRAMPLQPHFEGDFPHGRDQWISASATNWAAMALVPPAR